MLATVAFILFSGLVSTMADLDFKASLTNHAIDVSRNVAHTRGLG